MPALFDTQSIRNELGDQVKTEDVLAMYGHMKSNEVKKLLKEDGWASKPVYDGEEKKTVRKWCYTKDEGDFVEGNKNVTSSLNPLVTEMVKSGYTQEQMQSILDMMSDHVANQDVRPDTPLQECRKIIDSRVAIIRKIHENKIPSQYRLTEQQFSYVRTIMFIDLIDEAYPMIKETKTYPNLLEKKARLEEIMLPDPVYPAKLAFAMGDVPELKPLRLEYMEIFWPDLIEWWGWVGTPLALRQYCFRNRIEIHDMLAKLEKEGVIKAEPGPGGVPHFVTLDEEKLSEYALPPSEPPPAYVTTQPSLEIKAARRERLTKQKERAMILEEQGE